MKEKIHKQTKPVLTNTDVKQYQEELHEKFVIVTIDKASNSFAFICRKYYISKLFGQVSPNKNKNSTSHIHKCKRRKLLKLTSNTAKKLTL